LSGKRLGTREVGCGVWGVGSGVWGVGCGVWGVGGDGEISTNTPKPQPPTPH
jgi:hypothetical protein